MASAKELLSVVKAHGPGLSAATVGESAAFTIVFKDASGNLIETSADLAVEVRPQIDPNIAYNDDGTFTCTYTPTATGELQVAVKLDDLHIEGSPWTVSVRAPGAAADQPSPTAQPTPTPAEAPAAPAHAPVAAAAAPAPVPAAAPAEPAHEPVPAAAHPEPEHAAPAPATSHAEPASTLVAAAAPAVHVQVFSASGLGLHEAVAGRSSTFEVACRGAESGALEPAKGRLQVSFDGPKAITHVALRAGATVGTYIVEYLAAAPGAYIITVADPKGKPVLSSPFALRVADAEVRPAAPTAAKAKVIAATRFTVVGPGSKEAVAGKTARFEIHGRDDEGNLAPSTARLEVSFHGPRPIYAPAVTDGGARGVWQVEYQAVKEGTYQMNVTADGKPIDGAPFSVQVAPGEHKEQKPAPPKEEEKPIEASSILSASKKPVIIHYELVGGGLKEAVAGKTARFHILAKDAQGNQVPSLAKFDVTFQGPRPVYAPSVKEDPEVGRGAYHVEYQVIVPGTYQMSVTADGHALEGSPFEVQVSGVEKAPAQAPRKSDPEVKIEAPTLKSAGAGVIKFTASGAGVKEAVAGKTAKFEVHVQDESGAHVPTLKRIEVSFDGPRPVYAPSVVESATKGIYNVEYLTPVGGTYRMTVTADGAHIEGSPFEINVQAADKPTRDPKEEPLGRDPQAQISVSLKSTNTKDINYTVQGAGSKEAQAGKTAKFEIQARDADGLLVPNRGKIRLAVSFEGPRPVYAPAVTEDPVVRGVYRVEYSTPAAGTYLMHITSDGQPIANSPFTVNVSAASTARPAAASTDSAAATAAAPAAAAASAPAAAAAPAASTASAPTPTLATTPSQNMDRFKYEAGGVGLTKGHAGRTVRFTVTAKDKQTRPIADTGLEASAEGPEGEKINVTWEEQPKGVYAAAYTPTKEGVHKVSITVGGGHVSRSPYSVTIKAPSSAAHTAVENWYFTVKTRSANGDDQEEGEDVVNVEVRGPSEVAPKVKDLGNGEYFVSLYGLKEKGAYSIAVNLNGTPLASSPFTINKS